VYNLFYAYIPPMTPLYRIRKKILGLTQAQMADIAQTTQATVCRWESGGYEPDRHQMSLILVYAKRHGFDLQASAFFDDEKPKRSRNHAGARP
jgi:predicted transcriptional regulator